VAAEIIASARRCRGLRAAHHALFRCIITARINAAALAHSAAS